MNSVSSWYSWAHIPPVDPTSIITNAYINKGGVIAGKYENSADFLSSVWASSSPLSITAIPTCVALGTDAVQNIADATQWIFDHLTGNLASSNAIPLRKVFFVRGGTKWENDFALTSGGTTIVDMLLTFRNNAGTRGDDQATVPCIGWRGYNNSGTFTLGLTFNDGVFGTFMFVLWAKDNGGNISTLEIELNVIGPNGLGGA